MEDWKDKLSRGFDTPKPAAGPSPGGNVGGFQGQRSPGGVANRPGFGGSGQGNYSNGPSLPKDYLQNGFLIQNSKGEWHIDRRLLNDDAEKIGQALAFGRGSDELKYSQFRKFYDYAVNIDRKYKQGGSFEMIQTDLDKLKNLAHYAKSRKIVPQIFLDFMVANVSNVNSQEAFTKGMLEHFQAVVAYFKYHKRGND